MKKVFTLVVFLVLAWGGAAQCLSGNCQTGSGLMLYANSERYVGQFWEGKKHGEGTYYYRNGSRYTGQWANDQVHGAGVKHFKDGSRLEGFWEKGMLMRREETVSRGGSYDGPNGSYSVGCISGDCSNGKGIFIFPNGAIYVGEFRRGEINGSGALYYADGSKFQGEWLNRQPEGHGTKTYPDGSKRTGRWRMGLPVDEAGNLVDELINTKESANDGTEIQSGCISGDCIRGQGVFAYADGSRYEGQFYNGKPEGWGTFLNTRGEKFSGTFQRGTRHGRGRLEKRDGTIQTGEWRNGEYVGEAIIARTSGCVEGDCSNGSGTYVYKDGARYTGKFFQSQPNGRGTIYYTNGERYEGEVAGAAPDGDGTLFLADGGKVSGRWESGVFLSATGMNSPASQENRMTISASMTNAAPPFTAPMQQQPAQQQVQQVRVWAVIIGVAAYNHMPVLRYTDDDAYRIFAFLKSPEGGGIPDNQIRILIDEDATKKKILEGIEQTFGQAGPNDLVVLYFSGHGLKGSFLPYDFDGYNNKLYHEEINNLLRRSPARYKLCIADACHSGSLLAMRGDAGQPTLVSYYESLAKAQPGTALIMSSKSDETSLESSGLRQGVFSHFLIRGLKGEADRDHDQTVSVQELYDYIQQNVRSYTGSRQSPLIQGDYDRTMTVAVVR